MHLFTVTERYFITDRGLVLLPGLGTNIVTVGSTIRLVRPDKTELFTTIKGITFEGHHDILIGENIAKEDVPIGTEVWLIEYKKIQITTRELRQRLKGIKRKDGGRLVFGASTHRYRLNWTLSNHQLADFERRYRIELPKEYRDFLRYAGDGGAGPGYGLLRLRHWALEAPTIDPNYLSTPFPHSESWNMPFLDDDLTDKAYNSAIVEREAEYFNEKYATGSIRICHYGCAIYYLLVVSGPEAGHIWIDDRANDQGIYPTVYKATGQRLTFAEWYNEWLTDAWTTIG